MSDVGKIPGVPGNEALRVSRYAFELVRTYMLVGDVPAAAEMEDDAYLDDAVADPLLAQRLVGFYKVAVAHLATMLVTEKLKANDVEASDVEVRNRAIHALSIWTRPPAPPSATKKG